jgi:hypothetical protein
MGQAPKARLSCPTLILGGLRGGQTVANKEKHTAIIPAVGFSSVWFWLPDGVEPENATVEVVGIGTEPILAFVVTAETDDEGIPDEMAFVRPVLVDGDAAEDAVRFPDGRFKFQGGGGVHDTEHEAKRFWLLMQREIARIRAKREAEGKGRSDV